MESLTVLSKSPEHQSINISTDSLITVDFNLNIDPLSIGENSFYAEGYYAGAIDGTYSINDNIVKFTPSNLFQTSDSITVTITTDIQTLSGLTLDQNYTWEFVIENVSSPVITTQPIRFTNGNHPLIIRQSY